MNPTLARSALVAEALAAMSLAACSAPTATPPRDSAPVAARAPLTPPVAERRPKRFVNHGDVRIDDYYWLRDRNDPKTIAYLEAENAYAKAVTAHTEPLQETLYREMLGRIKETDLSAPYRKGDFFYYSRTEEGKAYPIYCRKRSSLDAPEEILLDANALAAGKDYFRIGVYDVSPDHRWLAFSVDNTGAERYTLHFKNLDTGALSPESIPDTYYSSAWAADNKTFFYTTVDAASRPYRLWRHTLAADPASDAIVHEESDERFFLSVDKTRSERFILITLESMKTTEARVIDADQPHQPPRLVAERRQDVEYSLDHHGDLFYIVTNDNAVNFRLMSAPVDSPHAANWKELIPHRPDATIEGVDCFANHLVVYQREGGNPTIHVYRPSAGALTDPHTVSFPESAYDVFPTDNHEFNTPSLRFTYTSLITPRSVFDYDMNSRARTLVKEQPVLGGYDRARYDVERIFATAADGKKVPISLVYRKGTPRDGSAPCLLYAYGSYGSSSDPAFNSNHLSLLDRGMIYAIAHVRGGSEMGRTWYEDGRLQHKRNTFTDFIACAEHLIRNRYTSHDRLAAMGGSAGGLLMGAVANMRPDLFKVIVAIVPFVDVVNTMLDPTIPLTVIEWEQWGDPNKKEDYERIKSYSPYDNIEPKRYPHILVMAGLNDPRVAYWEPAKWTARLRAAKTDDNILVLKTNMGAGHGGASGRYERLRELAYQYAFILDRLGLGQASPR